MAFLKNLLVWATLGLSLGAFAEVMYRLTNQDGSEMTPFIGAMALPIMGMFIVMFLIIEAAFAIFFWAND